MMVMLMINDSDDDEDVDGDDDAGDDADTRHYCLTAHDSIDKDLKGLLDEAARERHRNNQREQGNRRGIYNLHKNRFNSYC